LHHTGDGESAAGLVLVHDGEGQEHPEGLLGEWLSERGVPFDVLDATRAPIPALDGVAFVASLGSEESATNTGLRWVGEEIALLREAVARAVPVLGLCFGGQALSLALGGAVAPAPRPQIGWFELESTSADIPGGPWFHWHYEQFGLAPGARPLAHSDVGLAAFGVGPHLGLQFHPEVTTEVIAFWARSEDALARLGVDPETLVADSARRAPQARSSAWALFDAWWRRPGD
jgi:GMP synthase-like glutamine amidotransferase